LGRASEEVADARSRAGLQWIRTLLAAEAENGSFNLAGRIDSKDAAGTVLLTVPFEEAVAITGRDGQKQHSKE
jgi:hypothetical protein